MVSVNLLTISQSTLYLTDASIKETKMKTSTKCSLMQYAPPFYFCLFPEHLGIGENVVREKHDKSYHMAIGCIWQTFQMTDKRSTERKKTNDFQH